MPIAWTESLILRLVILYSKHECLRNPFHPNFKNKLFRYKAYKEIVDSMNVCGLTICDCIKRITYIKSQYCYELSKISAAISCEKFYKPTASWFPIIHQLFFPYTITYSYKNNFCKASADKTDKCRNYHYNGTHGQLTRLDFVEPKIPKRDCDCLYAVCHCDESFKAKPRFRPMKLENPFSTQTETKEANRSQITATDCTNYLHLRLQKGSRIDSGNNTRKYVTSEYTTQTDISCFKTTCISCQVCLEGERSLNDLENVISPICIPMEQDVKNDEFDMFGKSVAFQLRNISFEAAIKLEKRIQDLIAQERLGNMQSIHSDSCTTSSCSECKILSEKIVCSCGLPVIMIKADPSSDSDCKQRI